MAIISCPECGKQVSDRAASCPECGYPINSEAAATNNQQSAAKEVEKLLVLARRAREGSDSKNAKKYYDQILDKDPGNWEAIFYSVYFEAIECKIRDISSAANSVANCMYSTFAAISDLQDESEQNSALLVITTSSYSIATMLVNGAVSHYTQFSTTNNAFSECSGRVVSAGGIYSEIEASYKKVFPGKTHQLADHQKAYANFLNANSRWFNKTYLTGMYTRLGAEIQTVYPEYQAPTVPQPAAGTNSGCGCYVATAVYGSYDCPQVWTLRRFRDYTLAETWYGRAFIRTYYAISPTLVKWFGKTEWFKKMWKPTLDKMVKKLNSKGVESTPYNDKQW
jgi:hypothetical protein